MMPSPGQCMDSGYQFIEGKRLDQIIIRAASKPQYAVVDCVFRGKNQHVGARTKHIDVRAHFIRELEDEGYLKVQFVRSEENSSDILNKNCPEKLHTKHAAKMRNGCCMHLCRAPRAWIFLMIASPRGWSRRSPPRPLTR